MSGFPSVLFLRSATSTADEFKIDSGKTLTVVKDAVAVTDAVNKRTLDANLNANYNAVKILFEKMTGTTFDMDFKAAYDTLPEVMKAVTDEVGNRVSAVSAEATARINAIAAEAGLRSGADDVLRQSLATEVSDRMAAVAAEAQERERVVGELQQAIDTNLATAISDAVAAEALLRSNADTALDGAVQNEVEARISAIQTVTTAVGVVASDLAKEITDRVAAVTKVAGDLITEMNSRIAGDAALQAQINDTYIAPYSSLIFPDECVPLVMPNTTAKPFVSLGHQGWYFINNATQTYTKSNGVVTPTNKINWYLVNNSVPTSGSVCKFNATVGDVNEINIPIALISKTSVPFITIYTKLKTGGPNESSWYSAKKTWTLDGDGAGLDQARLVNGGQYLFRVNVNAPSLTATYADFTNIDLKPSIVATSTRGTMNLSDEILSISIGTDSGSAANNVEFIVKHFEIRSATKGNKKILFLNNTIRTEQLYKEFYGSA
jgi:DNA-binding ferritin-like protein